MENQTIHQSFKASLFALHPYQLACMILSVIAIVGALAIIFVPTTGDKLNDGALALIGSIVSFWMGRMGGSLANNNNNNKQNK